MKIYQIVPTLNFGDAIGNDVIAIKHVIEDMGFRTAIYAKAVADKITEPDVYVLDRMPKLSEDDIVIYHMGSGTDVNKFVAELNCRKIMRYHNITPPHFFDLDNPTASEVCRSGLKDMNTVMKGSFTAHIAVSEFNKNDMIDMGYKAGSIDVIPIIFPFDDYRNTAPDPKMVKRLSDGVTNIVFVGRIAPNKKHEDIIRCFAYYKKHVDPKARLILAGGANLSGIYYNDIQEYIKALDVNDVVFPGHISFAEILAIYKTAHVFLCMSEHEGFCVPLLEAMTFDVPVVAYDACAVPETLGGSAVVVDNKDPVFISKVLDKVVHDEALRTKIINAQRERLKRFDYEVIKKELQDYLRNFMTKFPPLSPDSSDKTYRKLYDIVDGNMKSAGKTMEFTPEAVLACADREAECVDVTALLNRNLPVRAMIETVYTAFFNSLPEKEDYDRWETVARESGREEFIRQFMRTARVSEKRENFRSLLRYDPFADGEYRREGDAAAT